MPGTLNLTLITGAGRTLRLSSEVSSLSSRFVRPPIMDSAKQCRPAIRAFSATVSAIVSRRPASLYEVLRIKQNASSVEIKSAYRSLAKMYHPDSAVRPSESDERDFIEIHDAYETLSDPSARALYDLSLMAAHGGRRLFSSSVAPNGSSGFYQTRRWETDQCW
ncbi:chaperone protein dnaJ 11, chloroplastic-like [Gastrolobium bilobum]|uniref:chaperone protein dnaJ 11, chloroplastic-like n=1 Tax=Gastrolobium bilobum TaxID=150636 RepID=UPI002AB0F82A|nr:chaperone protein dnaJ 11, chloroplastic-like [Gastrolobium bilobum]